MLDDLAARGIELPDKQIDNYNFSMSGTVAFCDDTTGVLHVGFSSDREILINEFSEESIRNFRSIAASQRSDLVAFFLEAHPDTGIYDDPDKAARLIPFEDVQICDFVLTLRGNLAFTDGTSSGFVITHEFGVPFDHVTGDDEGDIAFALLVLDQTPGNFPFEFQFEEMLNKIT